MPLNVDPKLRKCLISFLEENLPKLMVNNGQFLEYHSMECLRAGDKILPTTGRLKNELNKLLNEEPFFEFTTDNIARTLLNTEKLSNKSSYIKLSALKAFLDISASAVSIIDAFDGLPFRYTHTFELPMKLMDHLGPANKFTEQLRIIKPNEKFESEFPLNLKPRHELNWSRKTVYFQVEKDGYVNQLGTSKTTVDAEATLRAFFGLGLALGLFTVGRSSMLPRPVGTSKIIRVHKKNNHIWILDSDLLLDTDVHNTISRIEFYYSSFYYNNTLYYDKGMATYWVLEKLQTIRQCFCNKPKTERVLLASRWLFDSHIGQNELLSFVQTMIALEILLGDKQRSDLMGLN
jgi:hypothetical protein